MFALQTDKSHNKHIESVQYFLMEDGPECCDEVVMTESKERDSQCEQERREGGPAVLRHSSPGSGSSLQLSSLTMLGKKLTDNTHIHK